MADHALATTVMECLVLAHVPLVTTHARLATDPMLTTVFPATIIARTSTTTCASVTTVTT